MPNKPQHSDTAPVTLDTLRSCRRDGRRFACLTAYDASFAARMESAGVDVLLVGDSLGMVIQGHATTLPVTLADTLYHSRCVARARRRALLMVDMPFMSYATALQAVGNAGRLMQEGGAQIVKLEGGAAQAEIVAALGAHGIPVCAHLGLQPQSVHKLGGYKVQGRGRAQAEAIVEEAAALETAGADVLLLEAVPVAVTEAVMRRVRVPVIGIGAGPACDGQVLVSYDMLGITPGRTPRFARNFMEAGGGVDRALRAYVAAVRDGSFPGPEHCFE